MLFNGEASDFSTLDVDKMKKKYIGDGAYVDYDGFGLILTTEDGINITNRIYLESDVYDSFLLYVKNVLKNNSKDIA